MSTPTAPNTAEQVALVSAANANQLTSALAQAAIQSAKNADGTTKFPDFQAAQIPFGSTITVTNTGTGNLGKLAIGVLSALGLASALLGLGKGAVPTAPASGQQPISEASSVVTPPAEKAARPLTIEGILNWELTPDGQLNTVVQPAESAGT
jgi:hypothetical protein